MKLIAVDMDRLPLETRSSSGNLPGSMSYSTDYSTSDAALYGSRWRSEHVMYESLKSENYAPNARAPQSNKTLEKGSFMHLFAGGIAGCASTLVTCPIDVIKTRQQSSGEVTSSATTSSHVSKSNGFQQSMRRIHPMRAHFTVAAQPVYAYPNSVIHHGRYILEVEGLRSFYKGLGPSLMGVVPSRALLFYSKDFATKKLHLNFGCRADSGVTQIIATTFAGFISSTLTSPLWVMKTKQQLHRRLNKTSLSMSECMRKVWRTEGAKGFYRGLTASYAGIVETVIYFVIYEQLKGAYIRKHKLDSTSLSNSMSTIWELPGLMVISSLSKCAATCIAYPHEVVRTRLREEPVKQKYSGFFQTVRCISAKEGLRGLYGGLPAQLIRQVPNMAILMGVYEGVVYVLK